MPLNIRDAENSWIEAKRTWDNFVLGVMIAWNAPLMLDNIANTLQMIPPEVLDRLPEDTRKRLSSMTGGR